jgi:hypothetical protein
LGCGEIVWLTELCLDDNLHQVPDLIDEDVEMGDIAYDDRLDADTVISLAEHEDTMEDGFKLVEQENKGKALVVYDSEKFNRDRIHEKITEDDIPLVIGVGEAAEEVNKLPPSEAQIVLYSPNQIDRERPEHTIHIKPREWTYNQNTSDYGDWFARLMGYGKRQKAMRPTAIVPYESRDIDMPVVTATGHKRGHHTLQVAKATGKGKKTKASKATDLVKLPENRLARVPKKNPALTVHRGPRKSYGAITKSPRPIGRLDTYDFTRSNRDSHPGPNRWQQYLLGFSNKKGKKYSHLKMRDADSLATEKHAKHGTAVMRGGIASRAGYAPKMTEKYDVQDELIKIGDNAHELAEEREHGSVNVYDGFEFFPKRVKEWALNNEKAKVFDWMNKAIQGLEEMKNASIDESTVTIEEIDRRARKRRRKTRRKK